MYEVVVFTASLAKVSFRHLTVGHMELTSRSTPIPYSTNSTPRNLSLIASSVKAASITEGIMSRSVVSSSLASA